MDTTGFTKKGNYWYKGRSKNPYREHTCPTCLESFLGIKSAKFCSHSCAMTGIFNPMYKGTTVLDKMSITEYKKYHARVYRAKGSANYCINGCTVGPYQWANQTGKYDDIEDYKPMCSKCHVNFDKPHYWGTKDRLN